MNKIIPLMATLSLLMTTALMADAARTLTWLDLVPDTQQQEVIAEQNTNFHDLASMTEAMIEEAKARMEGLRQNPRLVMELNQKTVKIPGYVVPLDFGEDEIIYEFLLVPYFGACIHFPPPPTNQIIYITYPQGLQTDELFDPFWVEGTLITEGFNSEIAQAGYSMQAEKVELYQE